MRLTSLIPVPLTAVERRGWLGLDSENCGKQLTVTTMEILLPSPAVACAGVPG